MEAEALAEVALVAAVRLVGDIVVEVAQQAVGDPGKFQYYGSNQINKKNQI